MPRHEAIKALDIYKRAGQQVFFPLVILCSPVSFLRKTMSHYNGLLLFQANSLSDFYEVCKGLELARNFQFPVLREVALCKWFGALVFYLDVSSWRFAFCLWFQPPQSFLVTMEEYIREAPRMVSVSSVALVSFLIQGQSLFGSIIFVYKYFIW